MRAKIFLIVILVHIVNTYEAEKFIITLNSTSIIHSSSTNSNSSPLYEHNSTRVLNFTTIRKLFTNQISYGNLTSIKKLADNISSQFVETPKLLAATMVKAVPREEDIIEIYFKENSRNSSTDNDDKNLEDLNFRVQLDRIIAIFALVFGNFMVLFVFVVTPKMVRSYKKEFTVYERMRLDEIY